MRFGIREQEWTVNDMTRAEAYWILHEMMVETFSGDQSKALSIALNDIQFVDLMPNDTVPVCRCKDCVHWEDGWLGYCTKCHTAMDYDGFCSYGERKEAEGNG